MVKLRVYLNLKSLCLAVLSFNSGCRTFDRLAEVNEVPPVSHIVNPVAHTDYRPVTMPMPAPQHEETRNNSLWKTGAKTFFKDQQANRVGDILTVLIDINDNANLSNQTTTERTAKQNTSVTGFLGLEDRFGKKAAANLMNFASNPGSDGKGSIRRTDQIKTRFAVTIIQILPNGNLVISGRQEMRVNYEVRQLAIVGVVRAEDISSANTIPYDKTSEARMIYDGRGQLDDVQQAPWGAQVLGHVLPF